MTRKEKNEISGLVRLVIVMIVAWTYVINLFFIWHWLGSVAVAALFTVVEVGGTMIVLRSIVWIIDGFAND